MEQGAFCRALQPNEVSDGREGQLYRWREDVFRMFHSQIATKFVFRYTSFFSMMGKIYAELAHQFIHKLCINACHTSSVCLPSFQFSQKQDTVSWEHITLSVSSPRSGQLMLWQVHLPLLSSLWTTIFSLACMSPCLFAFQDLDSFWGVMVSVFLPS